MKRELEDLELNYPNRFKVFYLLDKPPEGWAGATGYVSEELLKTVLPKKDGNVKIFVCGPPGMYTAVSGGKKSPTDQGELSGILQKLGYDKDQVLNTIKDGANCRSTDFRLVTGVTQIDTHCSIE